MNHEGYKRHARQYIVSFHSKNWSIALDFEASFEASFVESSIHGLYIPFKKLSLRFNRSPQVHFNGEICALCFDSLTKFPQAVINSVEAGNLSGGSILLSIFSPADAISTGQMKALITTSDTQRRKEIGLPDAIKRVKNRKSAEIPDHP